MKFFDPTTMGRDLEQPQPSARAIPSCQNLRLFRELSVWENVLVGAQREKSREADTRDRAEEIPVQGFVALANIFANR